MSPPCVHNLRSDWVLLTPFRCHVLCYLPTRTSAPSGLFLLACCPCLTIWSSLAAMSGGVYSPEMWRRLLLGAAQYSPLWPCQFHVKGITRISDISLSLPLSYFSQPIVGGAESLRSGL
jgi:hypothetical protein